MWWMIIAAGVVALLIFFYIIGKREIARDEPIDASIQRARKERILAPNRTAGKPLAGKRSDRSIEVQEVVQYAHTFHGFFTNDGLDGMLSNMQARELSLNTMCEALTAIGAQPIVPLLKQASLEKERYDRESDALAAPMGAPEHQKHVTAYLERMRALETAIDKLGFNIDQLSQAYARPYGAS